MRELCAACLLVIALAPACGEQSSVRIDPDRVLYDGEPYGDFLLLGDAVRECMGSPEPTLPRLVLVDGLFECYTPLGWRTVFGCTSAGEVYLVATVVRDSGGQLWSHELTHYFGNQREDDPCGKIALEHFSLELPEDRANGPSSTRNRP